MWCVGKINQEYKHRMMAVLKEYEQPLNPKYPRVCVDEKSTQLLSTPRGEQLPVQGKRQTRRIDYEYKRHGTINLFVAVEPKAGKRRIRVTKRRTSRDFAKFACFLVERVYTKADKVIFILDNLGTHKKKAILDYCGKERGEAVIRKIVWRYTPKHASWLNMAEIEIGKLSKAVLKRRVPDRKTLGKEVWAYQQKQNRAKSTINWKFTREKAREKFKLH